MRMVSATPFYAIHKYCRSTYDSASYNAELDEIRLLGLINPIVPTWRCAMRLYIREWRKHRSLTCEELGELVGKSNDTISRWERGARNLNVSDLEVLGKALVCTPYDLLFRDPSDSVDIIKVWADASDSEREILRKIITGLAN